jgi:hypothetical protein
MIIVIKPNTPRSEIDQVIAEVEKLGYEPKAIHGAGIPQRAAAGGARDAGAEALQTGEP